MSGKSIPAKISVCPVHGTKHQLSSGLCTDLDCVTALITHHANRFRSIKRWWTRLGKYGLQSDFIIWAISELLREEKEKNKQPTLNYSWLELRLRHYIWHESRKSNNPVWRIPNVGRKGIETGIVYYEDLKQKYADKGSESLFDEIINRSINFTGDSGNNRDPNKQYDFYELKQYIVDKFGEPWYLFGSGEITLTECAKLTNLKLVEVKDTWTRICKDLKDNYFGAWEKDLERIEKQRQSMEKNYL